MTDEAKALVERLRTKYCCSDWDEGCNCETSADLIETQAREIERLRKLIEATSAHFLRLNINHPIMWDGAIDAAMEAVCLEVRRQAAELAKWKALAETLAGYASHKPDCRYEQMFAYEQPCTCGLSQALTSYKEQRDD